MIFTCLIAFDSVSFRMSFFFFVGFADRRRFVHCSIFIVCNPRMIFLCIGFLRLCHTKTLTLFALYRLVCLWVHVFFSSYEEKKFLWFCLFLSVVDCCPIDSADIFIFVSMVDWMNSLRLFLSWWIAHHFYVVFFCISFFFVSKIFFQALLLDWVFFDFFFLKLSIEFQ